ncbi:ROK family protein [Lentibacillus cibarius]|uniref:fructokinase n=1 Tax=Lentibacillus cibarius TaxID=2583219 RepID=A0A5S3QKL5_9BACI|nr:ROK family protein [Lentibacillus cibarius]TMN21741.1 ROK family protein [Lentibacillus cibarius]
MIGGIEAGGTKFVCAVGDREGEIFDKISLPTVEPEKTLQAVNQFFHHYSIEALGVGSFGPINLDTREDTYGTILNTPKIEWKHFDLLGRLKADFEVPVYLDTDVNAACLGEYLYGAGRDSASVLYITIGTGIGAGFVHNGRTYQGKSHPEMGHIFVRKQDNDKFAGACPYHGNCLEGLASGTAIEQRTGVRGHLLPSHDEIWDLEAYYLAQAVTNYMMILSLERIILGGGVMKQKKMYGMIRSKVREFVNDYVPIGDVDKLIVAPELENEQGVKGAMALVTG